MSTTNKLSNLMGKFGRLSLLCAGLITTQESLANDFHGYWNFNGGEVFGYQDVSASRNHGYFLQSVRGQYREGDFGLALDNEIFVIPALPLTSTHTPLTFSFWLQADQLPSMNLLSKKRIGDDYSLAFSLQNGQAIFRITGDAGQALALQSSTTLSTNQWTQLAVTYDGSGFASGVKIYINGADTALNILDDSLFMQGDFNGPLIIGGDLETNQVFPGALDEILIAPLVYSAGQIRCLAEEGPDCWMATGVGPRGPKGETGDPGEPGDVGAIGDKGEKGDRGPQGASGSAGIRGIQGPPGLPGVSGDRGPAGTNGRNGTDGSDGTNGAKGPRGPKGRQGVPGPKGDRGPKGERGAKGETGDRGVTGNRGPRGPKGHTGLKGDPGGKGARGDQGPIGFQGPPGDKGERGDKGNRGPAGDPGPTGDRGPQGPQGDRGPQGDAGPRGFTGDRGTPGRVRFGCNHQFQQVLKAENKVQLIECPIMR